MTTVLVVGATGQLGGRIAHHCLGRSEAKVRLLVRQGAQEDAGKGPPLRALVARGATLAFGDLRDEASLMDATAGADVVVSAVQGGPDVIVDGQVALARAAQANGVRRIFPSDFAVDLFKAPKGEHPLLAMRREADERIAELGLESVHVLNGAFMDILTAPFFQVYDADRHVVRFWGDGNEEFDATSIEDTARFTARAALDRTVPAGKLAVSGERLSFVEIAKALGQATGQEVRAETRGSIDELNAFIARTRAANPDPMATVPALYQLYMITGRTALDAPQNERFPELRPESFGEFLARTQPTSASGKDPA
ncbi:MAG: NmrA family NAD(P)-binding protein [Methylobacteriaceae bacterium]|nr:NmrA family NAD(P)-binding protein [Methylobacteriaceae bacterium]